MNFNSTGESCKGFGGSGYGQQNVRQLWASGVAICVLPEITVDFLTFIVAFKSKLLVVWLLSSLMALNVEC